MDEEWGIWWCCHSLKKTPKRNIFCQHYPKGTLRNTDINAICQSYVISDIHPVTHALWHVFGGVDFKLRCEIFGFGHRFLLMFHIRFFMTCIELYLRIVASVCWGKSQQNLALHFKLARFYRTTLNLIVIQKCPACLFVCLFVRFLCLLPICACLSLRPGGKQLPPWHSYWRHIWNTHVPRESPQACENCWFHIFPLSLDATPLFFPLKLTVFFTRILQNV